MTRWQIAIEVYPHSTGNGQEADQKAAGERVQYFYVDAADFAQAAAMARCFAEGVARSPAVWEAPIMGVHVYRASNP